MYHSFYQATARPVIIISVNGLVQQTPNIFDSMRDDPDAGAISN